jgi:EAL domain-containing protein (putative c-di-GMP-specific phosphodiesterase class I)
VREINNEPGQSVIARVNDDNRYRFDQPCRIKAIARHCLALFAELQITPLAEGIETREEMACLREPGISLMQGYLFARTGFETLPEVDFASL